MSFVYTCPFKSQSETKVDCQYCDTKGNLWSNKESDDLVINCHSNVELQLSCSNYIRPIVGQKMSKEQVKQDRQKRSTNHFKETVYDSNMLSRSESKHFSKTKGFRKKH